MTLRVGIVSAAWGAFAHLPAWRAVPGVEVTAICTSRRDTAEAASQRLGIPRAFWDAEAMMRDPDIDIVDVGTRPSLRVPWVLAALAAGKHVYDGIPFAADLAGARAMHQAWAASGRVGVVDAYAEWLPAFRHARDMLEGGAIGRPFGGTCVFAMSLFNELKPGFPYNWFSQGGLGVSAVRNLGSHALHLLVSLFGPVAELVACDLRLLDEWRSADGSQVQPVETNDFADMLLRFESGLTLQFQVTWNAPLGRGWHLDVFGSDGRMTVDAPSFPTPRDTIVHAGKLGGTLERTIIPDSYFRDAAVTIDADSPVPPAYGMALSMNRMVQAIRGEVDGARPDFGQAWEVERIQEAIRLSSAERRWVRLAEID